MHSILQDIIENKKRQVKLQQMDVPLQELKRELTHVGERRDFRKAIAAKDRVNIIAEIKYASPSRGIIQERVDSKKIAKAYESGGASAISVLTEEKYFKGSTMFLREVKKAVGVPVLRKDFILEPYQVYESLINGADAILLIASLFDKKKLNDMVELSKNLGLDCLVEVHSIEDIGKISSTIIDIVGVNNRDLDTFKVNTGFAQTVLKQIPRDKIVVVESGISSRQDIAMYTALGVTSFLIGETLMRSENVKETMHALLGERNGKM